MGRHDDFEGVRGGQKLLAASEIDEAVAIQGWASWIDSMSTQQCLIYNACSSAAPSSGDRTKPQLTPFFSHAVSASPQKSHSNARNGYHERSMKTANAISPK